MRAAGFLASAVLAAGVCAGASADDGPVPQDVSEAGEALPRGEDLSRRIDDLVSGALADGLLEPNDPVREAVSCPDLSEIDLAQFDWIQSYANYAAFEADFNDAQEVSSTPVKLRLASAQLSLGLVAEARQTLSDTNGNGAAALAAIATLLERVSLADATAMAEDVACAPHANLWLAAIAVSVDDIMAPDLVSSSLNEFRKMPLRVRARLLERMVAPLVRMGEGVLARQLLLDLSPEEAALVSEARLARLYLDLASDNTEGVDLLIENPVYRKHIADLVVHTEFVLPDDRMSQLVQALQGAVEPYPGAEGNGDEDFSLLLELLVREGDHGRLFALALATASDGGERRSKISAALLETLETDLRSEGRQTVLTAITALANHDAMISEMPGSPKLVRLAATRAAELGYGTLVLDMLGNLDALSAAQAEKVASLAYQQDAFGALFALAERTDAAVPTLTLAALAATKTDDPERFRAFETRLSGDPNAILALAESEAVSGHGLLSEDAFRSLASEEDPAIATRFARVSALRGRIAPSPTVTTADTDEILGRARRLLDRQNSEGS